MYPWNGGGGSSTFNTAALIEIGLGGGKRRRIDQGNASKPVSSGRDMAPGRFPAADFNPAIGYNPANDRVTGSFETAGPFDVSNGRMDITLYAIGPKDNKKWNTQYPIYSPLFARRLDEKDIEAKVFSEYFQLRDRAHDSLEFYTPHMLNLTLAKLAMKDKGNKLKLKDYKKMFPAASIAITGPVGSSNMWRQEEDDDQYRAGDPRAIVVGPYHYGIISNIWGPEAYGGNHPCLFTVWKMVRVPPRGLSFTASPWDSVTEHITLQDYGYQPNEIKYIPQVHSVVGTHFAYPPEEHWTYKMLEFDEDSTSPNKLIEMEHDTEYDYWGLGFKNDSYGNDTYVGQDFSSCRNADLPILLEGKLHTCIRVVNSVS